MILTGPRVYYAMAEEGLFFRAFRIVGAHFRAPVFSQDVSSGPLGCMLDVARHVPGALHLCRSHGVVFYGLAVAAVIVLRIRQPELDSAFPRTRLSLAPGAIHDCRPRDYFERGRVLSSPCSSWDRFNSYRIARIRTVPGAGQELGIGIPLRRLREFHAEGSRS